MVLQNRRSSGGGQPCRGWRGEDRQLQALERQARLSLAQIAVNEMVETAALHSAARLEVLTHTIARSVEVAKDKANKEANKQRVLNAVGTEFDL